MKNLFVKALSTPSSNVSYYYCSKIDHKAYAYDFKKLNGKIIKMIWVPIEIVSTNPKGSKMTWVLKFSTWFFCVGVSCSPKEEKALVSW